jgi:hypothetical protein
MGWRYQEGLKAFWRPLEAGVIERNMYEGEENPE